MKTKFNHIIKQLREFTLDVLSSVFAYKGLFLSFLKNPYSLCAFFILLVLNLFALIFYIIFFPFFFTFWLYKYRMYTKNKISEVKPTCWDFELNSIGMFFFINSFYKSYLISFLFLYKLLSLKHNKNINRNKTTIFLNYFLSLAIKIITGLPRVVLVNSFVYSIKFFERRHLIFFFKKLYFDVSIPELSYLIPLEKLRIYKTEKSFYNFNPGPFIIKITNKLNNSLKRININSNYWDDLMIRADIKKNIAIMQKYVEVEDIQISGVPSSHSATLLQINGTNNRIIMNQTSKIIIQNNGRNIKTPFMFKTHVDSKTRYLTEPGFINLNNTVFKYNTQYKINDSRFIADTTGLNFCSMFYQSIFINKDYILWYDSPDKVVKLVKKSSIMEAVLRNYDNRSFFNGAEEDIYMDLRIAIENLIFFKNEEFGKFTVDHKYDFFVKILEHVSAQSIGCIDILEIF